MTQTTSELTLSAKVRSHPALEHRLLVMLDLNCSPAAAASREICGSGLARLNPLLHRPRDR